MKYSEALSIRVFQKPIEARTARPRRAARLIGWGTQLLRPVFLPSRVLLSLPAVSLRIRPGVLTTHRPGRLLGTPSVTTPPSLVAGVRDGRLWRGKTKKSALGREAAFNISLGRQRACVVTGARRVI